MSASKAELYGTLRDECAMVVGAAEEQVGGLGAFEGELQVVLPRCSPIAPNNW